MDAICQRCGRRDFAWTVLQAEFNVGSIEHWKVKLCRGCTQHAETAVHAALEAPRAAPEERE